MDQNCPGMVRITPSKLFFYMINSDNTSIDINSTLWGVYKQNLSTFFIYFRFGIKSFQMCRTMQYLKNRPKLPRPTLLDISI